MTSSKKTNHFAKRIVILEKLSYLLGPLSSHCTLAKPPQATPKLPRRQGSSPNAAGKSQAGKMSLRDREERKGRGEGRGERN